MSRKNKRVNDIVADGCWDTKVRRLRGEDYDGEDIEEEMNVDRCVKCRKWFILNANGECDKCLKTSDQVVQLGSESC